MRNRMILATAMFGFGVISAQIADQIVETTPALAMAVARKSGGTKPATLEIGISITIPSDARGYFMTDSHLDGQSVGFMVDTGASVVVFNEKSAALFGLRPTVADYNAAVSTANGMVNGARVRLARLDIGGIVVHDIDAIVLPDAFLKENLLGLSFLSKLKRFEFSRGKLVLEQ
jgi:aspartyl protease family protein